MGWRGHGMRGVGETGGAEMIFARRLDWFWDGGGGWPRGWGVGRRARGGASVADVKMGSLWGC